MSTIVTIRCDNLIHIMWQGRSERIKSRRTELGLTHEALRLRMRAKLTKPVTRQAIIKWEKPEHDRLEIKERNLVALAHGLRTSREWILGEVHDVEAPVLGVNIRESLGQYVENPVLNIPVEHQEWVIDLCDALAKGKLSSADAATLRSLFERLREQA